MKNFKKMAEEFHKFDKSHEPKRFTKLRENTKKSWRWAEKSHLTYGGHMRTTTDLKKLKNKT